MSDINDSKYDNPADKGAEEMEVAWKERMYMMAAESKLRFTDILWRLSNLGQLI